MLEVDMATSLCANLAFQDESDDESDDMETMCMEDMLSLCDSEP